MAKRFFPDERGFLQTNRSDKLGSLWSTFNLDFQSNLGAIRLANKLVTNTTSSDDGDLGLPVAFEFWYDEWWAVAGTRLFKNSSPELTATFAEDTGKITIGAKSSQYDITNPSGNIWRYTYDGTGTNPGISATTMPVGATIVIDAGTGFAAGNQGTFTISGSGTDYFEVTHVGGTIESNKTSGGINGGLVNGAGFISLTPGTSTLGTDYSTISSDLKIFNNVLWATSTNALRGRASDTAGSPWVHIVSLTNGSPHPMVFFEKKNRLYVANQSTSVYSVDKDYIISTSGSNTLTIPTSLGGTGGLGYISSMVANSDFIWIGRFRDNNFIDTGSSGLRGCIIQWDGFQESSFITHTLESAGVVAMCVVNQVPYAMDCEGRVLKYTGYSFEEIARLPINRTLLTNVTTFGAVKFIHFNGMTATKNNTILFNINNLNDDAGGTVNENLSSGIWELDLATNNFTHKYSPTLRYLGNSPQDYGQERISAVGAIKINTLQSAIAAGRSTLIAGYTQFTDATTTRSGIFIDFPSKSTTYFEEQKRGYFVTTWFNSNEITDNWTRIWATFRRFLNSTDKISLKYRFNEEEATLATITWTSTTTFTTTTDVSAYVGGEVEILQGTGSGSNTHITTITGSGTYTITLDTAVTGVTGTAKARFQKWIKLGEITGQVLQYGSFPISFTNTRIQIKCVMEFTGDDELHKIILNSEPDLKAIS